MTHFNESFGQWRDRLLATPNEQRALWAELRATFTTRPVCPECARFIHPALWDAHMARHHEDRVGLAEEAKNPPPLEEG